MTNEKVLFSIILCRMHISKTKDSVEYAGSAFIFKRENGKAN
jgi:hypothetical protein